jgi:hypothetical protein
MWQVALAKVTGNLQLATGNQRTKCQFMASDSIKRQANSLVWEPPAGGGWYFCWLPLYSCLWHF